MGKKRKDAKGSGGAAAAAAEEGSQMITDPRFSFAHTDPRFRRIPRRESKVAIDPRFKGAFTDTSSAPVDKRGKRRREGSAKNSLKEFYRMEDDDDEANKKKKKKKPIEDESSEEESEKMEQKLGSLDEEESEESSDSEEEEEEVSEEEEEEHDTDEDEAIYLDDEPEAPEEEIPNIEKETHRLAIVRMDWRHVSAKDLYVVLNSFVPKDGRLLSVAVYPTDFGLERMKEEELHGPAIDGGDKKDDDDDDDEEEEEDEDVINEKFRDYEKSKLMYYHGVAECDSSATADFLYKSCDGLEFEKSSNKLDLRFIPDSVEFKHPPRDIATEAPANYDGLDFQSRALQLSKVDLTWDEDEPHRIKTLNRKFNPDQLTELELKEFIASDESESDDEGVKKKKSKEDYLALFGSGDVNDSDKEEEEEEENEQDMEVTFNTGLEDLSKQILEKKDKKSETVWESYLRQRREKKRARKSKQKDEDDEEEEEEEEEDEDEDFFMKERPAKKKEGEAKKTKRKEGIEEEEKSRAELELLLADDENAGGGGEGLKGYNIKKKGKKGSKEIAQEKIPAADLDDPRFSAAFSDPRYALDPTDPQFKRSATYARQVAQKQQHKEDPKSRPHDKEVEATKETKAAKEGSSYADSSTVKSLKLKIQQQKVSEKKKTGNTDSLAQRLKQKAQALSHKDLSLTGEERLKMYGIKDNLVRFSFGVEDFQALKADVLQALQAISQTLPF